VALPLWLLYLLIWLVIYRVTRLVLLDTVPPIGWARERVLNWLEPSPQWMFHRDGSPRRPDARSHLGGLGRSLHYLMTCPWCMSVWVGAATVYIFTLYVDVPLPWAVWIAGSAVTGLSFGLEERLSPSGDDDG